MKAEIQRRTDKTAAVKATRRHLRQVIDRACIARGEAQWTNGYRAARPWGAESELEAQRLYAKELRQFHHCGVVEQQLERALAAYARAIRRGGR